MVNIISNDTRKFILEQDNIVGTKTGGLKIVADYLVGQSLILKNPST